MIHPHPPYEKDDQGVRVIPAKVRMPTIRVDVVPRPRLLELLDADQHRVVLLSAPAGSGKTVLALDWLSRGERPAAWLSLDPLDNDPWRFHAHLAAAIGGLGTPEAEHAVRVLLRTGGSRDPDPELLTALGRMGTGTILVLDDVHHLEAPPLLRLLEAMISGASLGPRLLLLSRFDPPVPLARARLEGSLLELRERDLRFSLEETGELMGAALPAPLDASQLLRLQERTEGWAAGVRMAAIALARSEDPEAAISAFGGSHRLLADYLMEEALGSQSEPLRRFLLETSILPRFTPQTCTFVTGRSEAPELLREVEEANLFLVSLDARGSWYRYHHLFAELLEFRLEREMPGRVNELRSRAADWFEAEGDIQEALRQASEMAEPNRLLELLDRHGYAILARSEFASFARWLRLVPDPLSHSLPMFLVAVAWFRAQTQRAPALGALLAAIEAAVSHPPPGYPPERREEARLHLDALNAFVLRVEERFDEAIEAGEAALRRAPAESRIRGILEFHLGAVHFRLARMDAARGHLERAFEANSRWGIPYLVLASLGHLGAILAQTEGLDAARRHLEGAVVFAQDRGLTGVPAFAIVLIQLAQTWYLGGEMEAARAHLERALALTAGEEESDIRANVLIHLARVEVGTRKVDRGEELLTAASALAHAHNVKPFGTTLGVEQARLRAAAEDVLQTPETAPPSGEAYPGWTALREAEAVLQLQHSLRLERREEAAQLARLLRRESEPRRRGVALTVAEIGAAAVADDPRERWALLGAALDRAARAGYVWPLLECGPPLRALLETGLATGSLSRRARDLASLLLQRMRGSEEESPHATPPALSELLTEREVEVLAHLAAGKSNEDMARDLFLSLNTVKTHLKRIFAKLDVASRTQAAERARALGIKPHR